MELQLGLAISSDNNSNNNSIPMMKMKGFDLNCYDYGGYGSCHEPKEISDYSFGLKKRSFGGAFEQGKTGQHPLQTLPLFLWENKRLNEEDDDHTDLDNNSSSINKSDGDGDGVVGWPPIKSWRKKLCHQNRSCGGGNGGGGLKSTHVKVKMEGVAIARKVDLSLHHSYEELKDTLVDMFGRGRENVEAYKLTYQDREGDLLLAGDVPWSSFIQSVQRLKLQRSIV